MIARNRISQSRRRRAIVIAKAGVCYWHETVQLDRSDDVCSAGWIGSGWQTVRTTRMTRNRPGTAEVRVCAGFRMPGWGTIHALQWPPSEKRQGTKSRDVGGSSAAGAMGIWPRAQVRLG
jgi:hypothetical protein